MKINPDCIRAVLFFIEENQKTEEDFNKISIKKIYSDYIISSLSKENNKGFLKGDVLYSIILLNDSGYINATLHNKVTNSYYINYITEKGHDFIENTRTPENWEETKKISTKIGSYSLDILSRVASSVIASLINKQI